MQYKWPLLHDERNSFIINERYIIRDASALFTLIEAASVVRGEVIQPMQMFLCAISNPQLVDP